MGVITEAVIRVRSEYIENNYAEDYKQINNGLCPAFAEEVVSILNNHDITNVSMDDFFENEEFNCDENDKWDQNILEQWGIPYNKKLDEIIFGYHVWITDGSKHYDAECPEGVSNFLELPFFKRYLQ